MKYESFKFLVSFLREFNIVMEKGELEKILSLKSINFNVKDILLLLNNDKTIKNRSKWIDMVAKYGDDLLTAFTLKDILGMPHIRENDMIISLIMSEESYTKRNNLIRALTNLKVFENYELFLFIFNIEDKVKQKRLVNVLEFNIGYEMFYKLFEKTKKTIFGNKTLGDILTKIENSIIESEKAKLEEMSKRFIDNPTIENAIQLSKYQKYLDKVLTDELSMELPEVSGKGKKALIFKSHN